MISEIVLKLGHSLVIAPQSTASFDFQVLLDSAAMLNFSDTMQISIVYTREKCFWQQQGESYQYAPYNAKSVTLNSCFTKYGEWISVTVQPIEEKTYTISLQPTSECSKEGEIIYEKCIVTRIEPDTNGSLIGAIVGAVVGAVFVLVCIGVIFAYRNGYFHTIKYSILGKSTPSAAQSNVSIW